VKSGKRPSAQYERHKRRLLSARKLARGGVRARRPETMNLETGLTMRNNMVETLIGAAVVAVAVFFLFFAYRSTGSTAGAGYEVTAKLTRVTHRHRHRREAFRAQGGEVSALTLDRRTISSSCT